MFTLCNFPRWDQLSISDSDWQSQPTPALAFALKLDAKKDEAVIYSTFFFFFFF